MPKCTRKKLPECCAASEGAGSAHHDVPVELSPSSLIKFLKDATHQLQEDGQDILPVLRGIIKNSPDALSGDEARNFEEAAIDAVFDLSRVLLDLVTTRRGAESQMASLALFNVIPAVVGVKKCVQFLVSSTSALSNMYTKHWSNGMIHWGKAPNYKNVDESTDCFARLQRMHYLMRILNCRKEMLEQQTNMLKDQLKKHQMCLAGPSRARSKRRYHKRDMVSAVDFHEFKSSLKKDPEDLAECLQKMKMDKGCKKCRHAADCNCKGPDEGFVVNFKTVKAPEILLDIFESIFEDPYVVIRKEFSWNEENIVPQRYWHSIHLQLHLVHGAMESPSAIEIYADSYEEWSTFSCFFNVIERGILCPATRQHPLALKNLHGWLDMAIMYTKTPMKTHNIRLADDVIGGIRRTVYILNSCGWDSGIFAKMYQLLHLARQAFSNIKNRVKDPTVLTFDWTEMLFRELPWKNKRKLQMLAEVIPHWQDLDIKRNTKKKGGILGFGFSLIESLEFNELRSATCDVFKAILARFNKEQFVREFVPVLESGLANKKLHPGLANYWLPAFIKKYPDLAKNLQVPNLTAHIILLRALRKEGTISLKELLALENEDGENVLLAGLESEDVETRNRAICALCQGPNVHTTYLEGNPTICRVLTFVEHFLEDNLFISSQASRNIIMKAFAFFFATLRDFILFVIKIHKGTGLTLKEISWAIPITDFFVWLEKFICKGLDQGYSYQRNITTLQLYEVVLVAFSPADKSLKPRSEKLVSLLKSAGCFSFHSDEMFEKTMKCILSPAEDVRVLASKIVLNTSDFNRSSVSFDAIFKEALLLCSDRQFYIVESGALLYHTAALMSDVPLQDSVLRIHNQALAEFAVVKNNLLKGATENCPVHGCLAAINLILQHPKARSVSEEILTTVLTLVEQVTEHFLKILTSKSSTQEFAPSFEDMDYAIEAEINKNYSLDNKSLHLSPQFQFALSCAWLNLKTCSELASRLGNLFAVLNKSEEKLWRCSVVIMNVLQKCRHKGAFEAAGVSLGIFVKTITAQGSTIPKKMLDKLLSTLNLTGSDAPPLSRRSAGLAVAIHKIVSCDQDPEKELLHDTFEQLFLPTEEEAEENKEKESGLVDNVKTRKMHVLYTLVTDSGIGQHVNCHLENVGQMAIYYLNADDWGVKNAAMQLFGAFVKKIATQRKSRSSPDEESEAIESTDWDMTGNGLLEDVLIRSSYLVSQVVSIIKYPQPEKDENQDCTQLAPCCNPPDENAISCALGFLQCLTPGAPSLFTEAQCSLVTDIKFYCWQLLEHPSWLVRKQAANCCVTFINRSHLGASLKNILDEINKASQNKLHGLMMMVSTIKRKNDFFREDKKKFEAVLKEIDAKITSKLLIDLADNVQNSSFLVYKYSNFDGLKIEEVTNLLISVAHTEDKLKVEKYCQIIFTLELVEQIVGQQKDWIPELLALCCSFDSLNSVQEHLLMCLLREGDVSLALEEQLEIALLYKLKCQKNKHELMSVMKVLLQAKCKTWNGILSNLGDDNVWQLKGVTPEMNLRPCEEICNLLIKMLKEDKVLGDEFESLALSLIAYTNFEVVASGKVEEGCQLLSVLTTLLSQYLENNNLLNIAIVGPALQIICPVTWELQQALPKCPMLGPIGIEVLKITVTLLLQQDSLAVKSIWPLRSKTKRFCDLNPSLCLRKIYHLAIGSLLTAEHMEQYLWETLQTNVEFPKDDGIKYYWKSEFYRVEDIGNQSISSPFSHCDEIELDNFVHTLSAFESVFKAADKKSSKLDLPSDAELKSDFKALERTIKMFRESCEGNLQQLHPALTTAVHKFCLKVFVLGRHYGLQPFSELDSLLDGLTIRSRLHVLQM